MTNDSHDELSFQVADGFELQGHTGVQWPSLRDDSTEPPTDVVVLTDELLRSVEGSGVTPVAASQANEAFDATVSPAMRSPSLPAPVGPTTTEALRAIRPGARRWVLVAVTATFVVALFGGLLLRESLTTTQTPPPADLAAAPLTPPPLVPATPELELVEFPAAAPLKPLEPAADHAAAEAAPRLALPPPRRESRPARRARTVPATDLLDAWQ